MFDQLKPFVPEGAIPLLKQFLAHEAFHLVVSKPRVTKHGDFRPPRNGEAPRLSVNGNLNQYAFFLTLVHEIAHLKVWNKYKQSVKPHGKEWKSCYAELLQQCLDAQIFPQEIQIAVSKHKQKPSYASGVDQELTKALKKYDASFTQLVHLEELPAGTQFLLGKKMFVRGEKLRKRFLCTELSTGKKYRVHALAEVEPLNSHKIT